MTTERRMLEQLAKLLRHHHAISIREAPLCLVVTDAGASVAVTVEVNQSSGGLGTTIQFRNPDTGWIYGTSAEIDIVARKVRHQVSDPARQALISAHETLLQHLPSATGGCIPCGEQMPCATVNEHVKIMDEYGHLDPWEKLRAEQGGHACTDWIHPYTF